MATGSPLSSTPAFQLTDPEFQTNLRWRLGLPLSNVHPYCSAHCLHATTTGTKCGASLDPTGTLAVTCSKGGGREAMHSMVITALLSASRAAKLKPTREVVVPALTRVVAPRTKARYLRHNEPLPVIEHLEDSVLDIHAWGPNAPNYLIVSQCVIRTPHRALPLTVAYGMALQHCLEALIPHFAGYLAYN